MSAFAETSFLFAFYFPREASARAIAKVQSSPLPLHISSPVRLEFQQAVWFEVWRKANGDARGLDQVQAQSCLAAFDLDLGQGVAKQRQLRFGTDVWMDADDPVRRARRLRVLPTESGAFPMPDQSRRGLPQSEGPASPALLPEILW